MSYFIAVRKYSVVMALLVSGLFQSAHAEIQPSASAVLIPDGKQEASIDIKNNGNQSVLLYSKITRLPDDNLAGGTLYADPQTILMAPGDTQTIRIIYRSNSPDQKEHIARVIFTGLLPKDEVADGKVKILVGQDLPVVIGVRKDLGQQDIWQRVIYRLNEGQLCIKNPTAKVFRFAPSLSTEDASQVITFSKPYVLPNEELCGKAEKPLHPGAQINIVSVSDYNYRIATHKITL